MTVTAYRRLEVLLSSGDERPQPLAFEGRWLLEPADDNWSRTEAWSVGWCWGVAEESDGGLLFYRYHINRLRPPVLKRYANAADAVVGGVPGDIVGRAFPGDPRRA